MIGKEIRSYSHLIKSLDDKVLRKIIFFNGKTTICGYAIKNIIDSNNVIYFINNNIGNNIRNYARYDEFSKLVEKNVVLNNYSYVCEIYDSHALDYCGRFITLFPDNISDMYLEMINNNKKLLSSIYHYVNVSDVYDSKPLYIFKIDRKSVV